MKLTRLMVTNHSRLTDLNISIREHAVFVGPNDAGKSSLLRCLNLLLGSSTAQLYSRITVDDFRSPAEPFMIEADLAHVNDLEKALFPDEISIDPSSGSESLTLRLAASLDDNQTISIERVAPEGGTGRQISHDQLAGISWRLLQADSPSRDLGVDRRNAITEILQSVNLGAEKQRFDSVIEQLGTLLDNSTVLGALRSQLATQLSKALPRTVTNSELSFVPRATADDDALNGVHLQITQNGQSRDVGNQSDGTRALFALALYDIASIGANMIGIDEPELHLHPGSQRNLGKILRDSANQRLIATHSADIVGMFPPEQIVAVREGGRVVQPAEKFLSTDERTSVGWWVRDRLEPLTARRVVAIEGISDHIIFDRVAEVENHNLDRLGVSVIEVLGAGNMKPVTKLFGSQGFDIPISMLIDEDFEERAAVLLAVEKGRLPLHSVWVSRPDLEGEYVAAVGHAEVWAAISHSSHFNANQLANCRKNGPTGTPNDHDLAAFCRKYKVPAAMAVAPIITQENARRLSSVINLIDEIA